LPAPDLAISESIVGGLRHQLQASVRPLDSLSLGALEFNFAQEILVAFLDILNGS
jgi:hypothetical protein